MVCDLTTNYGEDDVVIIPVMRDNDDTGSDNTIETEGGNLI